MPSFEYAQWTEYTAFKGAFFKGAPITAIFFTTATTEVLLPSHSLLEALNEVGAQGWEDYRIDVVPTEPAKRVAMTADRITCFAKLHGFVPGAAQLEATRWFRRESPRAD